MAQTWEEYNNQFKKGGGTISPTPQTFASPSSWEDFNAQSIKRVDEQKQKEIQVNKDIEIANKPSDFFNTITNKVKSEFAKLPEVSQKVSSWLINTPIKKLAETKYIKGYAQDIENAPKPETPFGEKILQGLSEIPGQQIISGLTGGIFKAQTEAPKDFTHKAISIIGEGVGSAAGISLISKGLGLLNTPVAVDAFLANYPKLQKYAAPFIKNAASFAIYGQLEPNLADNVINRFKKLASDVALSVPFSGLSFIKNAKFSVPASFALGAGVAKFQGASNEDAILAGITLGTLDAFGRIGGEGKHFVTGRFADRALRQEAVDKINEFSTTKIKTNSSADLIQKAYREAAHQTHPDLNPNQGNNFKGVSNAYRYLTGKDLNYQPTKSEPVLTPEERRIGQVTDVKPEEIKFVSPETQKLAETQPLESKGLELLKSETAKHPTIESFTKALNEHATADLENIVQFHGTQKGEELTKALQEGKVQPSQEGLMGKGFYVTGTPELGKYFGAQVKSETGGRVNVKKEPDVLAIDLSNLNIKRLDMGKGEYYDFLKEKNLDVEQYNDQLKAEGYDGLNLVGRGETIIFNFSKVKGIDLNAFFKAKKPEKPPLEASTPKAPPSPELSVKQSIQKAIIEELPSEIEEKAQSDWENNFAESYGELENKIRTLQKQIKEAPKTEKIVLQSQINEVVKKQATMEESFINKWQGLAEKEQPKNIKSKTQFQIKSETPEPISTYLKNQFGVSFEDANKKQVLEAMSKTVAVLPATEKTLKKIATPKSDIDNVIDRKPELFWGGISKKSFTDSYIAILDPKAADQANQDVLAKEKISEIKNAQKHAPGVPFKDIEKMVSESMQKQINDKDSIKNYPDINSVVPKEEGTKAIQQGYYSLFGKPHIILSDGKMQVVIQGNYLAFINKYLKDYEIRITGARSPVKLTSKGKTVALIMPVMADDLPIKPDFGITEKTLPKITKPEKISKIDETVFKQEVLEEGLEKDEFVDKPISKDLQPFAQEAENVPIKQQVKKEIQKTPVKKEKAMEKGILPPPAIFHSLDNVVRDLDASVNKIKVLEKDDPGFASGARYEFEVSMLNSIGEQGYYHSIYYDSIPKPKEFRKDVIEHLKEEAKRLETEETVIGIVARSGREDLYLEKIQEVLNRIEGEKIKTPSGAASSRGQEFAKFDVKLGGIDAIRPVDIPEMVEIATELMGRAPSIVRKTGTALGRFVGEHGDPRIKLIASLFEEKKIKDVAVVMAHEIGHLIDWLPDETLSRGNLAGRLRSLTGFMKTKFEDENGDIVDKEIRKELIDWTRFWHPYDPESVPVSYKKYRESSRELYADAISGLLNSPGLLEEKAPQFYKEFFAGLDTKEDVKLAYFAVQDILAGTPEKILEHRQQRIKDGFNKAETVRKQLSEEKKLTTASLWEKTRQELDDYNYPILKRIYEKEAQGVKIPDEENPKYILQEQSLVDNENYLFVLDVDNQVKKSLEEKEISYEDLGVYAFLRRVIGRPDEPIKLNEEENLEDFDEGEIKQVTKMFGDRKDLANPWGFYKETAQKQLDFMKEKLGAEKYKFLEDKAETYRQLREPSVDEAVRVGTFNKEVYEKIVVPNKGYYIAFGVTNHLQKRVPATIKGQLGTLSEIENPITTDILKTIALNRLNAYQRAKNATIKALPESFTPSKRIIAPGGKFSIFKVAPDKGAVEVLENGKLVSYDTDPYIAEAFNRYKVGDLNVMAHLLNQFNNKIFKPLVTTYNLGFAVGFNPQRDFRRNYKNIPNATLANLLIEYIKALPSAHKYAKGELDALTREMVENKALGAPINDYVFDKGDDEFARQLERFGIAKAGESAESIREKLLKPVSMLLGGIKYVANIFENISKIAGYQIRKVGGEAGKELAHNVRNYTGTPNYRTKGLSTETTNALFIFSNIFKEGFKTDAEMATNPKTRNGWWWKTVKIDLMPKFLMFLAASGALGIYLKKAYGDMSEYDKSNYMTFPIGTHNGKTVYMRFAHDETARLISAVFWKMLNFAKTRQITDAQDIVSLGAGQLPNLTPAVSVPLNWLQYLSGKNPYDTFRGRPVIDDITWQAGGGSALKKMIQWSLNNTGITTFTTYDPATRTGVETFFQLAPFFNRVIKISDYGQTEMFRKIKEQTQKENAQEILSQRTLIDKYVKEYLKAGSIDAKDYEEKLIDEAFKNQDLSEIKSKVQSLKQRFRSSLSKGKLDSRYDALLSASTNDEKLAILKKIKEGMSSKDFQNFLDIAQEEKAISNQIRGRIEE